MNNVEENLMCALEEMNKHLKMIAEQLKNLNDVLPVYNTGKEARLLVEVKNEK